MKQNQVQQKAIHLGTHGENYGSWMSNPVFYVMGALLALSVVLAVLSFVVFHITALGVVFVIAAVILLALLLWCAWIRRQYAFGGGGMMDRTHLVVLSHLDFGGQGQLLEVGCGSGPLSIRAALTWPSAQVVGIDYWGADFGYNQAMCEKNAASEGVAARCRFQHGDANKLDFPDESFDAVVSNYVYHNIMGSDKRTLLLETLRVLKKGGVFALNDEMKPRMYGDMETFAQEQGYLTVDHIWISTADADPADPEAAAACRARAEEAFSKLNGSADPLNDFAVLAATYSDETDRDQHPSGYTCKAGDGTLPAACEEAVLALEEGQFSGVVEADDGFYLILRKPVDLEAVAPDYFDALLQAAAAGLGLAVLSRQVAAEAIAQGKVGEVAVEGLVFRRQFRVVWHREKVLSPLARDLLQVVLDQAAPGQGRP